MAKMYFENQKTGKRYEIVGMNKEAGEVRLKNEYAEFSEPYDKDRFKQLGYTLVKEE